MRVASAGTNIHDFTSATRCFPASLPHIPYRASATELAWIDHRPVLHRVCEVGNRKSQRDAIPTWLNYSSAAWYGGPLPTPDGVQSEILSSFEVEQGSDVIEPLTGVAAPSHLNAMLCSKDTVRHKWQSIPYKYDLRYLILSSACPEKANGRNATCRHRPHGARSRFYDLGCSMPYGERNKALREEDILHGGGLGPSIATFQELYRRRCIEFDDYYAWEAELKPPERWWAKLPAQLRAKMHFYNVPVAEGTRAQALDGTYQGGDSFLNLLMASAQPKDFVVVKIDIEGQLGAPEMTIIEAIESRPELAALVDELFFEGHFYSPEHCRPPSAYPCGWGSAALNRTAMPGNIDDVLAHMHKLRTLGIRSHFWI